MQLFISWSGDKSRKISNLFYDWIQQVLQPVKPWASYRDIQAGTLWEKLLHEKLGSTNFGVVFVTQDNKDAPFIHFESGLLCKGLEMARVCTFLVDMTPEDLTQNPLTPFHHTVTTRESIKNMVHTLNINLGENRIKEETLNKVFDKNIDELLDGIDAILKEEPVKHDKPSQEDLLIEILKTVRSQEAKIREIEASSGSPYFSYPQLYHYPFFKKGARRLYFGGSIPQPISEEERFRNVFFQTIKRFPSDIEMMSFIELLESGVNFTDAAQQIIKKSNDEGQDPVHPN